MAFSLRSKIMEIKRQREAKARSPSGPQAGGQLADIQELRRPVLEIRQNTANTSETGNHQEILQSPKMNGKESSSSDEVRTGEIILIY